MHDWWSDLERDVLDCVKPEGPTPLDELSRRLNLSEDAATSLVAMLAREGKLRISAVESSEGARGRAPES
jgi:DNA-binding Lrp family transcriptional regulator